MILTQLLILGGAAAVGRWLYNAPGDAPPEGPPPPGPARASEPAAGPDEVAEDPVEPIEDPAEDAESVEAIDRALAISLAGTGASIVGATLFPPASLLALGSIAYSGRGVLQDAAREARQEGRPTIAALDLAAISIGVVAHLYFLSNSALALYYLGLKLNRSARAQHHGAIRDAIEEQAVRVRLADAPDQTTDLRQVQRGDRLIVEAGELIPVDGVIVEGSAGVDRGALTGEALPEECGPGDAVHATSLLLSGRVVIEVQQTGAQTVSQSIARALEETQRYEARLVERSQRLADATAPPTFGVAGVALLASGPTAALAVMGSNYVGALRVSSPLSMHAHLRRARASGLFIKDGRTLELIEDIDTVVFDKTGTLTEGRFDVSGWRALPPWTKAEVLRWAAAAERRQTHPIARALREEAEALGLEIPPTEHVEAHLGNGVRAQVEGRAVAIGSARFIAGLGVRLPEPDAADEDVPPGSTTVHVAVDGALAAVVRLTPRVRAESHTLIRDLQRSGRAVLLLSGDHEAPTAHLAAQLGADGHFAEVLPGDKAAIISRLQAEGRRVCFIGDGLNDALALKNAQLSVAVHSAAALASDSAQVVLLGEGLSGLSALFRVGEDFDQDQRSANMALVGTTLVAAGGALLGAFGLTAVTGLYLIGAGAGTAIGLRPLLSGPPEDASAPG